MSTINISLPETQVRQIDKLVSIYGFANRSEFMRSILRFLTRKEGVLDEAVNYPFEAPSERSIKKIVKGFEESGKYNREFIKDLEEGLQLSDYFQK
jgi:Arc/MetJ-type ribon-helix-helix transcriptional regulator